MRTTSPAAIGYRAGFSNTTGSGNTASGSQALSSNTTGARNIAIGYLAGSGNTVGNDSIFLSALGSAADNRTIRIGIESLSTSAATTP